jgi:site-specific recombinase XerD
MPSLAHPTISDWLANLDRQGKSHHTCASYRRALAHFTRWSEHTYGQPFDPAAIIPRDVADWKAYQQTVEKAKPSTVNLRLVALSRFFKWAVAQGHARSDPTADVRGLRLNMRRPRALDDVALRRLLRQVHQAGDRRDVALVELLLGAGLRISEALDLQREDVVLGERSGEVVVRRGKGGAHRRVPLTAPVRKALGAYLEEHPELDKDDPLWVGQRGPLHDRTGVVKLLKKYARWAGLDEELVSPHVLRHSFSTRYLAANPGDLRGLAALLGHANLNTVMIYTQPTTSDLAERMARAETTAGHAD